jgi:hypothetical protein
MRWIWLLLTSVVLAGFAAAVWPAGDGPDGSRVVDRPPTEAMPPPAVEAIPTPGAPADRSQRSLDGRVAAAPSTTTSPARVERKPDGSLLLDGRFVVTGSGSEQDPFVVSWPLLSSASEAIDAPAGRLAAPPHIAFLAGQWVQISGFLAPPLWGEQTRELLVMKNRWDGCCIGLPPTPFDCIEATLTDPVKLGARHSISFGTVRGRLVVEPFVAGSFLIGLYRLESAVNTTASMP